jgi:cysteine synthase
MVDEIFKQFFVVLGIESGGVLMGVGRWMKEVKEGEYG